MGFQSKLDNDAHSWRIKALLIAQARQRLFEDLLRSVYHLVFFGTPHQGANSTAGFLASLGATVGGAKDGSIIRELKLWSPSLMEADAMFVDIAEGFTITTFFEKEKTHGVQVWLHFLMSVESADAPLRFIGHR